MSFWVVIKVSDSASVEGGTSPDDSVNLANNFTICLFRFKNLTVSKYFDKQYVSIVQIIILLL